MKIIKSIYNRLNKLHFKKNIIRRGRKKDLSYAKYEEYVKDKIYDHLKNNILINTENYIFANKRLYYSTSISGTFTEKNIRIKMNEHNFDDMIQTLSQTFFT